MGGGIAMDHLTDKNSVTAMNDSDKVLQSQLDQLPKELTPSRDLWGGIEKAIADKPQLAEHKVNNSKVYTPAAWAASVVAAVLLTWYGVNLQQPNQIQEFTIAGQMHQGFEQQKQMMLTSFGSPSVSELAPEMQEQLNQLKKARLSIEKALNEDENNVDLIELLRWTQQQELKLLERLFSPKWQTI